MNRSRYLAVLLAFVVSMMSVGNAAELVEVRTILLNETSDVALIDDYLSTALIPALARQGIGPVGVLEPTEADETDIQAIFLVIPFESFDQVQASKLALAGDSEYQEAAKEYLSRGRKEAPYARFRSELLSAMDCWPQVKVPEGATSNGDRVFELRLYESSNERLGDLKVEMFNQGEVPIFLDCQILPIFIGQCVVGPQMPSLTYLTVYDNETARQEAWKAFRVH
ncbi:MAG: NIPSNAP family protein, partial [Planctomycetota bacterium]